MIIKFPKEFVTHKRKLPPPSFCDKQMYFGVKNKILTASEALSIYRIIEQCLDEEEVNNEIDLREKAGIITKEKAVKLRQYKINITEAYRNKLNDADYSTSVLDDVIFRFLASIKFVST